MGDMEEPVTREGVRRWSRRRRAVERVRRVREVVFKIREGREAGREGVAGGVEVGSGRRWVVMFFAMTVFRPVGVVVYSWVGRLKLETVGGIKRGLDEMGGRVAELGRGL